MSKAFNTINIHILIRKVLQTKIPGTIIQFIANYIKGRKAYTTYRIIHPHNVNVKLAFHHIPPPRAPVQVMAYADDFTITSTHTSTSAAKNYIKFFAWTLHPDKTTCTLFTPDPAEYKSKLDLKINNTALPKAIHPKVLGLT